MSTQSLQSYVMRVLLVLVHVCCSPIPAHPRSIIALATQIYIFMSGTHAQTLNRNATADGIVVDPQCVVMASDVEVCPKFSSRISASTFLWCFILHLFYLKTGRNSRPHHCRVTIIFITVTLCHMYLARLCLSTVGTWFLKPYRYTLTASQDARTIDGRPSLPNVIKLENRVAWWEMPDHQQNSLYHSVPYLKDCFIGCAGSPLTS
jgi:hypothetical protein